MDNERCEDKQILRTQNKSVMDYIKYIAAVMYLERLKEELRNRNVSSASIAGDLNKKIKAAEAFIAKQEEILLAEITEQSE